MKINEIICGDSLEVMRGMEDKSVDLILTDPPYGINVGGKSRERESKSVGQSRSVTVGILGASVPKVIGGSMTVESPQNNTLMR